MQDALTDQKLTKAMYEEMEALQRNLTWELVSVPREIKTIGWRWVYTIKLNVYGGIDRYKAMLVAKGYAQKYGVDYQETFALVAKLKRDYPLWEFDVKNSFLYGELEEEVHMEFSPVIKQETMMEMNQQLGISSRKQLTYKLSGKW